MATTIGSILLVESNPDIRGVLIVLLQRADFHVTAVGTVTEALSLAETQNFDLYLLNHIFPDGSGLTLCRALRASHPLTPIIFFSAAAHPREREEGLRAGATAYLTQPEDIVDLPDTLTRLISAVNGSDRDT